MPESLFSLFEVEEFEKVSRTKPADEPAPNKKKIEQTMENIKKSIDLYLGTDSSSSDRELLRKKLIAYLDYKKSCRQAHEEFGRKS